jgi:PAS domain S-box-containing protein
LGDLPAELFDVAGFRLIVEAAPNGILVINRDGRIVLVNAQAERLFGYRRDQLLGQAMETLVPERFRRNHSDYHSAFVAAPLARAMGRGRDVHGRRQDGSEFPVEIGLSPIETAAGEMVLCAVVDITERKRAVEEALRQREESFQLLVDSIRDCAIFMLDPEGRIATWNNGAKRLKGYQAEEILGRHFSCFYSEVDIAANKPEQELAAARELGQVEIEGWRLCRDGSQFWANVAITALRDGAGLLRGYANVTRDFTRRKETEDRIAQLNTELAVRVTELHDANRELESFCYSVSHDLHAPLRAIDGFSRIVLHDFEKLLPAEAAGYLRDIRVNTQQMARLIDDLLGFSRLSRQPLKKQLCRPAELVQECLQELQPQQQGRGVEILLPDLPECQADPALLKQVWINLLSNALKYTGKCKVALVEIGWRATERIGEIAYFVKDNGVGFDMRYSDKLFGVFQRLHRAEDYAGTGVGLAIVQRIVHRHGGRIWAEARPDQGATFSFTLS